MGGGGGGCGDDEAGVNWRNVSLGGTVSEACQLRVGSTEFYKMSMVGRLKIWVAGAISYAYNTFYGRPFNLPAMD